MRTGAIISGGLHAGAVLVVFFGLPLALEPDLPEEQPILVELVTIADKTTPQRPEPKEVKEEKAPEPAPPPKLKRFAAAPPPPPAPGARPVPKTQAPREAKLVAPPPPKPELKLKPKPKPKPPETKVALAPTPKPEPKAVPEPKEQPKPAEPRRSDFKAMPRPAAKPTPPNRRFDAGRLAALLDKSEKKTAVAEPPKKEARKSDPKDPAPQPAPVRSSAPLTMSEIDAIRYQIQQCWSIPAGARDAENLVVKVRVFLNPDGTLARPPEIVDVGRNDGFFRTAAESARRAVLKCTPLKNLPAEKYRHWRELTLTFNPRDMLDG